MASEIAPVQIGTRKLTGLTLAAMFGTYAELFDFAIAGPIAAIAWPLVFFPKLSTSLGLLSAISAFALTFLARPVGSYFFGHFGDRLGRRRTLVFTLMTVGVGTILIIVDPSYDVLGLGAIAILTLGRLIVGFGFGGEWGTSTTWVLENAYRRRRNFWTSILTLGYPFGAFSAGVVITVILGSVGFQAFVSFWWRVPFMISLVVVVIGAIIRYAFSESWIFNNLLKKKEIKRAPASEVLVKEPKTVLKLALVSMIPQTPFYVGSTVMLTYIETTLGKGADFATSTLIYGELLAMFLVMVIGLMAERLGRKNTIVIIGLILTIWSIPYAYLFSVGTIATILIAQIILFGFGTGSLAALSAFMSENFPAKYRASGSGLSYSIGIVLGVLPPTYVAAYALSFGRIAAWYIVPIMMVPLIISLIATIFTKETKTADVAT